MKKIILVDGNNLLFRSYYATSYSGVIMKNSKGFPTNGLYGFINMINKIIEEEKPNYILVAFDKGKTFRHEKYSEYKAGRREMPEELKLQFPKAKEVLDAMGIKHFEIDNYEADDIIGTLAKTVDMEDKFIATIISSDKDLLQLISKEVEVKLLKTKGFIRFDEKTFKDTYGTTPIHMIDLKALMGDASDHIQGVKGIGEKTAINLLTKYQSLDNVYEHLNEIGGKTKEKLEQGKDDAYMSYDLATIYKEVPIPFSLEDCIYKGMNIKDYKDILEELEFKSLLKKINFESEEQQTLNLEEDKKEKIQIVDYKNFDFNRPYSFYLEMDGYTYSKSKVIGCGFSNLKESCFMMIDELITNKEILENNIEKYTYDLKRMIILLHQYGININNCNYDSMIASYLLDYKLEDDITVLMNQFNYNCPSYEETYGTEKKKKEVNIETTKEHCINKSRFIYDTRSKILLEIDDYDETKLFNEIEMPLSLVLADMELTGIRVDKKYLLNLKEELEAKMESMQEEIYKLADGEFNILSPKQLGEVLFDKLKIEYPKKRKKDDTSYSTSKDILDKIKDKNEIVEKVLEYRNLSKLYANYCVGLLDEIREDGKIHTIFNSCLTRTGRLSSSKPNLQNIPIRSDYSKLVRKAFIPEDNSILMSSDYSQIELRVFAHMADAKNLQEAFIEDKDIHAKTASDIFKVPIEQVDKKMRRIAKTVNFGILYGISSFGLSEDLKIDVASAKEFLNNYLNTYQGIKEYMEKEKEEAYQKGYVTTIMNRRRKIDELKSSNYMVRSSGERMALNTPIQGSAADILKKAMVELYRAMQEKKLKSKILIQVHDELVFNIYNDELEIMKELVKEKMEKVVKLSVPLRVDIETGNDWYEAK
ncbi:MAG: DNA polymerase I [Bacilli bacterium]|jgi:DNA polymerase-1|nr:DNA polymerase I [Bacilli bacterium]